MQRRSRRRLVAGNRAERGLPFDIDIGIGIAIGIAIVIGLGISFGPSALARD